MPSLLQSRLSVVNVGLSRFAETIAAAGGEVRHLEWTPPARGDRDAAMALARLVRHPAIEEANRRAFAAFLETSPVLRGVGRAADTLKDIAGRTIVHAGPPIEWNRMCGPM